MCAAASRLIDETKRYISHNKKNRKELVIEKPAIMKGSALSNLADINRSKRNNRNSMTTSYATTKENVTHIDNNFDGNMTGKFQQSFDSREAKSKSGSQSRSQSKCTPISKSRFKPTDEAQQE